MLPDRVSNPGPLTYESGALPIALSGPAASSTKENIFFFLPFSLFGQRSPSKLTSTLKGANSLLIELANS